MMPGETVRFGCDEYMIVFDLKPFAFAGQWTTWRGEGEEPLETCTVLTTEANELLSQLHPRMPVILDAADYMPWLNTTANDAAGIGSLLRPFPPDRMKHDAVSRTVNNARNEGPDCIEPGRPEQ